MLLVRPGADLYVVPGTSTRPPQSLAVAGGETSMRLNNHSIPVMWRLYP